MASETRCAAVSSSPSWLESAVMSAGSTARQASTSLSATRSTASRAAPLTRSWALSKKGSRHLMRRPCACWEPTAPRWLASSERSETHLHAVTIRFF